MADTGAERYFAERMNDPEYAAAYAAAEVAVYRCKRRDGVIVESVTTPYEGHRGHIMCRRIQEAG